MDDFSTEMKDIFDHLLTKAAKDVRITENIRSTQAHSYFTTEVAESFINRKKKLLDIIIQIFYPTKTIFFKTKSYE